MRTRINGHDVTIAPAWRERSLLDFLREDQGLTGTKNGCGKGACGVCTILLDNKPTPACRTKAADVEGKSVLTIEGMTDSAGNLHPLQQAFVDSGAIQCGFCTPGMVLRAHAFLLTTPQPTRDQIRKAISPNLCRCTGYQQIIDAVEAAVPHYSDGKGRG